MAGQDKVDRFKLSRRVKEVDVQRAVIRAYEEEAWIVYVLSQRRATQQTPGLPDLLIFTETSAFFHETKTPTGEQRFAQKLFEKTCYEREINYVKGGEREARSFIANIRAS